MIHIKSEKEIQLMREAADILKKVLKEVEKHIKPGVTTNYLNDIAERVIKENGAKPSFYGEPCPYPGGKDYKHALCLSVNDEIIHGIPSDRVLNEGDIVCVDLGVYKNGFHSDAGRTFGVGKISKEAQDLINVAKEAFFEGINYAKEGCRVGDISNAIENYVYSKGYTLLEEYQGHGIGREMHEDPGIPNIGKKGTGPRLQNNMAIAVEPMVCLGSNDVYVKKDKWTIATVDGKITSYYENTLVITENGPEILTLD
ncbi:MAG: type I methionyl aminopeptidase [Clostridia bacterium]|nr:type I methionyl aminopeptidase [Clostridia bacterium]